MSNASVTQRSAVAEFETHGRIIPRGAKLSWPNFIPIAIGHGLAFFALDPANFSYAGLYTMLFFAVIVAPIGINLCYHRMLTHRGLTVPKWLERVFVIFAVCSLEGPPGQWVSVHRAHHKFADKPSDPHTPRESFFWAHIGWMLFETSRPLPTLYARDILQDPFYRRLQVGNLWAWIYFGHALLLYALGVGFGYWVDGTLDAGLRLGWSIVVWGVFVRAVLVWHVTWSVNSFTHYSGYRTYETRDDSRNNPIVAFFTAGEGWHNNHHGDPASCCNTHRWWEFDLTWQMIRLLAVVGLATDLVLPRAERRKQREQDKQAA